LSDTAVRVLLSETGARRSGPALVAVHQGIELVTIAPDGSISLADGSVLPREATGIEVAWATSDLYDDNTVMRPFFGLVRRLDTLRWFQSSAAGFDTPVLTELIRRGILFTKSDVHSVPIAEFVLRAVLDHFQRPDRWTSAQAERSWTRHEFEEIFGTTWVVVGLGSIGIEVAQRARAFGVHVIGVRRRPAGTEPVDELVPPDDLIGVLARADVVVLCAPANASTQHLVDRPFLAAMKHGALLVNIGRGSVVDEAALLDALETGPIGAAVLDVFETEPLPLESPLWDHPRVVVTPHTSALAGARYKRQEELFSDNLGRFLRGEPMRGVVTAADLD
jgi:phosphoglycerate dehydrogenase-like enzyme